MNDQRAARFGAIMAALWAAHDIGDHIAQTHYQAVNKSLSWRTMVGHVSNYTAVQVGVLLAVSRLTDIRLSWRRLLAGVVFSAATHAVWDRGWTVRWVLDCTGSQDFRAVIPEQQVRRVPGRGQFVPEHPLPLHGPCLADQALHHGCLIIAAGIIAGGRRG